MLRIGVISDTHGLLRPQAAAFLRSCEHILHAGDICNADTLAQLRQIAPVTAVRGNNDNGAWAHALAETEVVPFGAILVCVLHDLAQLDIEAKAAGMHVVVSGHSHRPLIEDRNGVLFVNPAAPARGAFACRSRSASC